MSKRAAVWLAATLVLGLLVAMMVVTLQLGTLQPRASASDERRQRTQKPIVKRVTRTITVHKKKSAGSPQHLVTVTLPPSPAPASASSGTQATDPTTQDISEDDGLAEDHTGEDHLGDPEEDVTIP
jgi:hypothetical protein